AASTVLLTVVAGTFVGCIVGSRCIAGNVFVGLFVEIGVAFHHSAHAGQSAVVVDVDERNPLCCTTHLADFGNTRTHQHTTCGDKHDFVGRVNQHRPHDLAVTGGSLDGNHAFGATAMAGVLGNRGTLAVTVFSGRQNAL